MEVYHYYAWQVTMLWLSSFFASMAPLGFLCVFVSFLLHYVLERLNFAYLYKERKPWGSKLNNVMIDMV